MRNVPLLLIFISLSFVNTSFSELPDDMIRHIMEIFLVQELRQAEQKKGDWPLIELNQMLQSIYTSAAMNKQNRRVIEKWIISDDIKKLLCAWMEKVSKIEQNNSLDVMQTAIRMRWFYITRFLLDIGCSAQTCFDDGRFLLHIAAFHNADHIIRLLVNRGALVDSQDKQGYTPLQQTIFGDNFAAAQELLKLGTDLRIKNKGKRTALQEIVWRLDNAIQLVEGHVVKVFFEPTKVFNLLKEYEKQNE